jgi:hypothetical protein
MSPGKMHQQKGQQKDKGYRCQEPAKAVILIRKSQETIEQVEDDSGEVNKIDNKHFVNNIQISMLFKVSCQPFQKKI